MSKSLIPQHKRMAMGQSIKRYADGGSVKAPPPPPPPQMPPMGSGLLDRAAKAMQGRQAQLDAEEAKALGKANGGPIRKTGMPENPITKERHMNGIPGMKRGGTTKGR